MTIALKFILAFVAGYIVGRCIVNSDKDDNSDNHFFI